MLFGHRPQHFSIDHWFVTERAEIMRNSEIDGTPGRRSGGTPGGSHTMPSRTSLGAIKGPSPVCNAVSSTGNSFWPFATPRHQCAHALRRQKPPRSFNPSDGDSATAAGNARIIVRNERRDE